MYSKNKLIENEFSTNLLTGDGWINVINPFRGSLVMGTPGSGKSYAILLEAIKQQIKKGFAMVIYDFKFNDLTKFAYNCHVQFADNYKIKPEFCILNFDDIEYTHRSNPLHPDLMTDYVDAIEISKSIMIALNESWGDKKEDFLDEASINFVSICIWALKLKSDEQKIYCSLPHLIELISKPYDELFTFLSTFKDDLFISNVLAPFVSAWEDDTWENNTDLLDKQIAIVRLGLSRLTSDIIYYVMTTGKDENRNISLDINNPLAPKILCIGNNPIRQKMYGACISIYMNKLIPIINKKGQLKTGFIVDELPTISFPKGTLDNLIATARSNKIAVWLGAQDYQQLIRNYSEKNAKVIINTVGNIFTGMVIGNTAKILSERFGKFKIKNKMQQIIPEFALATLKHGMFAGQIAGNFGEKNEQFFYSNIIIDQEERKVLDRLDYPKIFDVSKTGLTKKEILNRNFLRIKKDIDDLIEETIIRN